MPTGSQVSAWMVALGLLVPSTATGQDRPAREVVELIVRDGPQARAIRAEAEVTRMEQRARLAYPNPSVTYSREGAGFTEFLQADQALPLFGTRAALARAGVAATTAADADRDARLWTLRSEAAATVARLAAAQGRADATGTLTREIERLIEVLRIREREGEGSRFDRLRAEQELRDARQTAATAAATLAQARAALAGMLPSDVVPPRIAAEPDPRPLSDHADALIARATTTRAELRALQLLSQHAALEGEAARRARFPSPSVFGGMKRADADGGRDSGGVVGLTVAVPLFDTGGRESARWSAERVRLDAERAGVEQRIRAEIRAAAEILTVRQGVVAEEDAGAGDELARIAEVAYREDEVGILELLDAIRTASRARLRGIEVRLDARLAQIALERAVGETLWP